MNNYQIDIVSSFLAAIVANSVAHPLDTIKTRIQL